MIKCEKDRNEFQMLQKIEKHSMIWGMFMTVTMESAVFTTDLTLKQMFDISARLVSEQDEISGLETIGWENHLGSTCR